MRIWQHGHNNITDNKTECHRQHGASGLATYTNSCVQLQHLVPLHSVIGLIKLFIFVIKAMPWQGSFLSSTVF